MLYGMKLEGQQGTGAGMFFCFSPGKAARDIRLDSE